MKKLIMLFAAVLFAGITFACDAPDGYRERQEVTVFNERGVYKWYNQMVYQATNACDAYCICFDGVIRYVSRSDKDGYRYMFWSGEYKYYFNM